MFVCSVLFGDCVRPELLHAKVGYGDTLDTLVGVEIVSLHTNYIAMTHLRRRRKDAKGRTTM